MQGYQIHTTVTRGNRCLIDLHTIANITSVSALGSGRDLIVPTSPGHARIPNAYPPNRHRRR